MKESIIHLPLDVRAAPGGTEGEMRERVDVEGAAHLVLLRGARLLHPEEQVFEAMLAGWEAQQHSRMLSPSTTQTRIRLVRRFSAFTNDYPWRWTPADVEEWSVQLRADARRAHSTIRTYQQALQLFMDYLTDRRYGWAAECEERFGTHPVQICHEWNTAAHVTDYEGRPGNRPLAREELQMLFDHADEQVDRAGALGRKGWAAVYRDATVLKTIYAWGLRRHEAAMLDRTDFGPNAAAPEFGAFGMLSVRWGKATRGSPPRRRSVLTVMPWAAEAAERYVAEVRPLYGDGSPLWPTERGGRLSAGRLADRFAAYREALGLPGELGLHCLRHSYVTHLIEDGFDPYFVQQQVGHRWGSTTALYTGVSSDYKNRVLRAALDRAFPGGDDERRTT
jgi:site-specific recombinase XerD